MCPKCKSNKVTYQCIDKSKPPIWHFVCEICDMEWVE